MESTRLDSGFTITEVLISIIVMSLFLTLFFQLFFASESQRLSVTRLAEAHDIARSNLRKVTTKSQIATISPGAICDNTTTGTSNPNNGVLNPSLDSIAGSDLIANPNWATTANQTIPMKESLENTSLPSSTRQSLKVSYPRGCNNLMPAKVISLVEYESETVVHAIYIN